MARLHRAARLLVVSAASCVGVRNSASWELCPPHAVCGVFMSPLLPAGGSTSAMTSCGMREWGSTSLIRWMMATTAYPPRARVPTRKPGDGGGQRRQTGVPKEEEQPGNPHVVATAATYVILRTCECLSAQRLCVGRVHCAVRPPCSGRADRFPGHRQMLFSACAARTAKAAAKNTQPAPLVHTLV